MAVDLYFGDTSNCSNLSLGKPYPFHPQTAVHNRGFPPNGNTDGEGYTECPLCDKDFFVKALIRDGILTGIEFDPNIAPHKA
ncbi:MAG: hypothetical protein ACKVP0_12720 [Pirellulaceae bacterium]